MLNYQTFDKQYQSYVDKCEQVIVAACNCTCQIPYAIIKMSNFTQQIITSMKYSFKFLYSFGPTHASKIETEMILAAFNSIYIIGFIYFINGLLQRQMMKDLT